MIEVHNLSKSYGGFRAVQSISFSVAEGEIVGFLGPNGAGKTTTFRILTCYHPATAGSATVAGHDVLTDSSHVRQQIGYLPESVPLYPEMRVREYLNFRGKLRGLDREQRQQRIGVVTERCWIKDVIERPIGQLSKGFRQRVGLADALLHNPRVLILDEPTVGLDPVQIRETGTLIRELAAAHTVMLSSHILPQVEETCRRMLIIHKGRIVASGTMDELRRRFGGDAAVVAELRAPEKDVRERLRALAGEGKLSVAASDGWTQVRVSGAADVSDALLRAAVEKGWPLRALRHEGASLEDVFVKAVLGAGEAKG